MSKGLRFFGTNFNENQFDGTSDASSRVNFTEFAFDGLIGTKWTSSGEGTDGNDIYLERDYGISRNIDSFFVYSMNIDDIEVQYHNGSIWVTITDSISTITKSIDKKHLFVKLDSSVNTQKVRVIGSNTIVADEEKHITLFYAFIELGQFEYFPKLKSRFTPKQNVFDTTDGRGFVIERGEAFSAKIEFKSHVNQNDITLAESLVARKSEFFIWPNGGDELIFTFSFRPFRFQDIFKVAIIGDSRPELTKNYYKAGYNNVINLKEVV